MCEFGRAFDPVFAPESVRPPPIRRRLRPVALLPVLTLDLTLSLCSFARDLTLHAPNPLGVRPDSGMLPPPITRLGLLWFVGKVRREEGGVGGSAGCAGTTVVLPLGSSTTHDVGGRLGSLVSPGREGGEEQQRERGGSGRGVV